MEESQNQQQGYGNTPDNDQQQTYGNQGSYGNQQQTYGNQETYGNQQQTYGNQGSYGNQQQTYGNQQQTYGNQGSYGNQQYNNPPIYYNNGGFGTPQPMHGPVTDVFCYILLALMPLRQILGMISSASVFNSVDFSYSSIMNDTYMAGVYTPGYMVMTVLNYALTIAFIVLIVLDIVKIYKQHYKITGLVLFAIFLTPGYYIWRAYILGRKKTFPVIYTVCYSLLVVGSMIYAVYQVMDMYLAIFNLMM